MDSSCSRPSSPQAAANRCSSRRRLDRRLAMRRGFPMCLGAWCDPESTHAMEIEAALRAVRSAVPGLDRPVEEVVRLGRPG
jgi:hypothetical protein